MAQWDEEETEVILYIPRGLGESPETQEKRIQDIMRDENVNRLTALAYYEALG